MNPSINIKVIANSLKENFPEIPFAHIFGSQINARENECSDIDIAIWYNGTDPFYKVKVLANLEPILKNIPVDIVNIYNSGPLLAHEALAGIVLFVREGQELNYASFYTIISAEYEDRVYWIKKQLQYRSYEVQWNN